MAIDKLSLEEIKKQIDSDLQTYLPETDLKDTSILNILSNVMAGVYSQTGFLIEQVQKNIFPTTATNGYLEEWASAQGVSRGAGDKSSGTAVATSDLAGVAIPRDTQLTSNDGDVYLVKFDASTESITIPVVASLTGSSVVMTALSDEVPFAVGQTVLISGVEQEEYNGEKKVTFVSDNTFEFDIEGTPVQPTGSSIKAEATMASIFLESESVGEKNNLLSGARINFINVNPSIDATAIVGYEGLVGGEDVESDESLKAKLLNKNSFDPPQFSADDIINIAKQTKDITRVSVLKATPSPGKQTIYCSNDNAKDPRPSAEALQNVKNDLIANAPVVIANLDNTTLESGDIIVKSITKQDVDFSILDLKLSTVSMKESIKENLKSFFSSKTKIGEDVRLDTILAVIKNTVDKTTGATVNSFILQSPSSDLINTEGNIFIVDDVSFDN